MKTNKNIIINRIIIGLSILIMTGCGSAKYTVNFKKQKKDITYLTILDPVTSVIATNYQTQHIDSVLTQNTHELILETTYNLLSKKYELNNMEASLNKKLLYKMLKELEHAPKTLTGISISHFDLPKKNKFLLLLTFRGRYNPDFETNYNLKAGMANNMVYINKSTKPNSDLCLIIIDTEKEEVVYYDSFISTNHDPRLPSRIEDMIKEILKSIYYK